jgi:hypothetical protein
MPRETRPVCCLSLWCLALSCAGHPSGSLMPRLASRRPVCLTVGWHGQVMPTLDERPVPDTLVLVPGSGERHGLAGDSEFWGKIELTVSQQGRRGAGWVWWITSDTLHVLGGTMFDVLKAWMLRPGERARADWVRTQDLGPTLRGDASFRRFNCDDLKRPAA